MTQGDVAEGDIVFTTEAPLGNLAVIPDDGKYILSQRVVLLRSNQSKIKSCYLFHLLMSDVFSKILLDHATGSTAQGIKRKVLESLPILFPFSCQEQEAIAGVLSAMDEAIAALEQRLAKTKALKQGMMQELLTGRTRLV
jgi:type I restriction enzyme S subunit